MVSLVSTSIIGYCDLVLFIIKRNLVVEPVHLGSSSQLGKGARIFLDLFQDLMALCFKWHATSPSTARRLWCLRESQDLQVQSFRSAHRGRIYVYVFIRVSVCACYERLCVLCNSKK